MYHCQYFLNESISIIRLILKYLKLNKLDIKILIKTHPAVSVDHFLKKFTFPDSVSFTDKPTDSLMHHTQILISGVSNICMESICLGIPTIIIETDKCIIFDPIPKFRKRSFYKSFKL